MTLASDPNSLLGNKTPIQIPQVVVKWLTYALVLHIVALAFAAGSAIFGLLAHIREFSMTCCSTCISGFAAAITFVAFIFDIAFFFLFKARINSVPGGSAQTGNAIWLTLVAMLLLFFAGCFYTFGRCCINGRSRGPRGSRDKSTPPAPGDTEGAYNEAMRLDAVKAEADRKARQKQGEVGLPAFQEYDPTRPLTKDDWEDEPYRDNHVRQASGYSSIQPGRGGYVSNNGYAPAAPGTSAMDAYYNGPAPPQAVAGYPPRPSMHGQYPSNQYSAYDAPNGQPTHDQYASHEAANGHSAQETSCKLQLFFVSNLITYMICLDYATSQYPQQPSHLSERSYVSSGYPSSSTPNPGVEPGYAPNPPSRSATRDDYAYTPPAAPVPSSFPTALRGVPPAGFLSSTANQDYSFETTPLAPILPQAPIPPQEPLSPLVPISPTRQSPAPRGPRPPISPVLPIHPDNPPDYEFTNTRPSTEKA